MRPTKIIAGIEIGTAKTVVLVGEVSHGKALNIIGMGESTTMGMTKGEIEDIRQVMDCVHAAIVSAEKNAGAQIDEVYLAKTGASLEGIHGSGITAVSGSDALVSMEDVMRACGNARLKSLPEGRLYVHHIRTGFLLDGKPVAQPLGQIGQRLEALYWHVHAEERAISHHIHLINGIGLQVKDMIVSSIASGSILTLPAEKKQGVLVLDIGGGTTDYALYRNNRVQRTGVIPVGGDHVTNDLSLGLRISRKLAENLKLRHGRAIFDKADRNEAVLLMGDMSIGDRPVPLASIHKIINARLGELFMVLKNRLGSQLGSSQLPAGVLITGGVSRTPMIDKLAADTLGVDCRIASNPSWVVKESLQDPEYACALGLLHYGLYGQSSDEEHHQGQSERRPKLLGRLKQLLLTP